MITEGYSVTATPEQIVDTANALWAELRKANPKTEEEETAFETLARDKYSELYSAYPLVCRYMIYTRIYEPKVFLRWLKNLDTTRWKDDRLYLEDQAEYIVSLQMGSTNPIKRMRHKREVVDLLSKELEEYREKVKAAVRRYEEESAAKKTALREDLANWARSGPELAVSRPHAAEVLQTIAPNNPGTGAADDLLRSLGLC